ncbi:Hypothetical predicted protein [Mytilus galloprovincialis]|uniref:Ig-like domain-containing protein n=1 Tax=Mytilus galloprovincialis TaxID=29158 RepID=A0A8B6E5F0_MYTGA|nr:Hypothetical predicted protein [Mytilus galloprovincialis]
MKSIFIKLLVSFITIFSYSNGYDQICPHSSQWNFTSSSSRCADQKTYICLFDLLKSKITNKTVITETCGHEDVSREGTKYILNPNLEQVPCDAIQYQPFTFTTNGNSQCALGKSLCKSSGQILASNGSSFADASCRCDYTRSYDYIIPPKDSCSCKPAEEDCSCYIRKCDDDKVMIADYRCSKRLETILPEDIKCPVINRIIPPDDTDAFDKKHFQPVSSSLPHVTSSLVVSKFQLHVKRKDNEFMILNGDNVKIECNVNSYIPIRSVTWLKEINGEIIQITPSMEKYEMVFGEKPSLTLNNFNTDDQGKYRCIIRNAVGLRNEMFGSCMNLMSRFCWLTGFVTVLQHIPAFHTDNIALNTDDFNSQSEATVYTVYKGDDITLEQHIDGLQKLIAVKWFKESDIWTELDMSNEQYSGGVTEIPSLTINITTLGNAGKYLCLLIYDNGKRQKASFKLKILPQVKIYKALCQHREDNTFICPVIFETIDKHMQENNIVVITGREGSGKSKICLEIASIYDEKDYMVLKVDLSENHTIDTNIANALLIIDDQQYTQDSLNTFMKHILPVLDTRNIKVILTCRNLDLEIVSSVQEIIPLKDVPFIDMNSCLTAEEKEKILRRYMKENNIEISASKMSNFRDQHILTDLSVQVTVNVDVIEEIRNEEPWKGFPLCASTFCSERNNLHLGRTYFTDPPRYLFEELKELHETATKNSNSMDTVTEYIILVYILENSNHQLDINDPNLCRKFVELYQTLFQFKYIPEKPGPNEDQKIPIEKALHRMNNKYLKLHEGMYQFIHPCLSKAMFLSSDSMVYYLLQNGSLQDITEFVRSEDYTASENELVIKIDKQIHHILCERLVRHAFEDHELLLKVADYISTYWRLSGKDYTGLEDELVIKITKDFHHIFDERFMKHVSEDHDLLVKIAAYTYTHWHSSGNMLVNVFFNQIAFILFKSFGIYTDNLQQLDIEQNSMKAEIQVSLFNIIRLVERLTSQGKDPWIYGTGSADFIILSGLVTAAVARYAANSNQTFDILLSEFQKRIHSGAFFELLSKPLDRYGNTFFHYLMGLSQKEASEIVSVIAERKCVLDTENVKKYTPLDIAAFLGKKDIFKVLNLKTSNCTDKLCKRLKGLAKCGRLEYYKKNSKDKIKDQKMIQKTKDGSVSPEKLECEGDDNDKKEVIDENKKDRGGFKRENSLREEEHKKREEHDRKDVLCFEEFMNNIVDNGKIGDYQAIIIFLS